MEADTALGLRNAINDLAVKWYSNLVLSPWVKNQVLFQGPIFSFHCKKQTNGHKARVDQVLGSHCGFVSLRVNTFQYRPLQLTLFFANLSALLSLWTLSNSIILFS